MESVSKTRAGMALLAALMPITVLAAGKAAMEYSVTRTVALGAPDRWDYLTVDPASQRVYVSHGDRVTVVDGVVDGKGKLYVNGEEKEEIVRIDTRSNQVDAHWPLTNCCSLHGIAMDIATHRLFVGCTNELLVVVRADDGREVAHLPIGN